MPEVVKYERVQTTEADVHAQQNEDFDTMPDAVGVPNLHHQHIGDTKIEVSKGRHRFDVMQTTLATLALILFYFCLSIGLTFYQRWFIREFKFPLFVVLCHLIVKLIISFGIRIVYRLVTGKSRIDIDMRTSLQKMSLTGLASGIDIGFSNWGLGLVTISLYTMTKSTTVIFILFFAILLGLERKSWSLMVIVVMISSGLCLFTYKASEFNALGFAFLLFASMVSGLRWSFAQLIMQKSKLGLHNPIDMVYFMQPWMIASILPFTIGFEGRKLYDGFMGLSEVPNTEIVSVVLLIVIGAVIAFCMELSEFLVVSFTSSLTLAVAGIFKETCMLVLAVLFSTDTFSLLNVLGLFMCLGGISIHVVHKYSMLSHGKTGTGAGLTTDATSDDMGNGSAGTAVAVTFDKGQRDKAVRLNFRSGQNVPLLNEDLADTDSDEESPNGTHNSNDIIFDVLKRRDTRSQQSTF